MNRQETAKARLAFLALGLVLLWFFHAGNALGPEEKLLWSRIRSAQDHLAEWRFPGGEGPAENIDPWKTGLVGLEWSSTTTTLGDLGSKRTACDPLWAVRFRRWFAESGLKEGDRVAILASSSFPGMLLSAIAAAEDLNLDIFLSVSLGASTWGANDPKHPWGEIESEMRKAGFIRTRSAFYTLGGDGEGGGGLSPEGRAVLEASARKAGVPLVVPESLDEAVRIKWESLEAFHPRLLVSIGGSHGNLGGDQEILDLPPGLNLPGHGLRGGDGVIGRWLESGRPVIHVLDLKVLSRREGVPFDSPPRPWFASRAGIGTSLGGLALFFGILLTHRRWAWRDSHG
jgi:poly-gamma-glutamate system protein